MTAENTAGNLDRKVILTFPFDPWIPGANKYVLEDPPTEIGMFSRTNYGPASLDVYSHVAKPQLWQDTVNDHIMAKTVVGEPYAGSATTAWWTNPTNAGTDPRTPGEMTLANEFELDVNQLTHNFQSLTAVAPLPGIPNLNNNAQQ